MPYTTLKTIYNRQFFSQICRISWSPYEYGFSEGDSREETFWSTLCVSFAIKLEPCIPPMSKEGHVIPLIQQNSLFWSDNSFSRATIESSNKILN